MISKQAVIQRTAPPKMKRKKLLKALEKERNKKVTDE